MMKRILIMVLANVLMIMTSAAQTNTIQNPILPGFNPDPSICRVGDEYYICNSSFTFYPGLPIYRSKDLQNWELVAHAIDRPGMVSLDGVKDKDGVWAPTIRHHKGKWYIFCNVSNRGNFYITADDVRGPWSDPVFIKDMPGIDPSIFWDEDGKSYILSNIGKFPGRKYTSSTAIWMQEIDLNDGRLTGEHHYIATGHALNAKYAEGPHLYKIGKKYVLLVAEGGTDFFHAATVMTSDKLFGTYLPQTINPVLSQRQMGHSAPIQCVGHCDLVETPEGKWYAVALGKRMIDGKHTFTRETFICPVEVQNGELVFNPGYGYMTPVVSRHETGPASERKERDEHFEFDGDSLPIGWYYNRIPYEKDYTVTNGTLRLKLRPETIDSLVCPAMLMRKPTSHKYSATTKLTFASKKKNEQAGMVLHRNNGAYIALLKGPDCLELIIKDKGEKRLLERIPYSDKDVVIRLSCNDLTGVFSYGPSTEQLTTTAPFSLLPLTEDNKLNRFNGLGIGLYASSNGKKSKAQAAFDYYDYKNSSETE